MEQCQSDFFSSVGHLLASQFGTGFLSSAGKSRDFESMSLFSKRVARGFRRKDFGIWVPNPQIYYNPIKRAARDSLQVGLDLNLS